MPPMPLFFTHDSECRLLVVLSWRCFQQMVLLLDASKLCVTLDTNHGDNRIHDVLLGDLHPPIPLRHALEIAELYLIARSVPVELYVEPVVSQPRGIESNPRLPVIEFFNPCLKVRRVTFYYLGISH